MKEQGNTKNMSSKDQKKQGQPGGERKGTKPISLRPPVHFEIDSSNFQPLQVEENPQTFGSTYFSAHI